MVELPYDVWLEITSLLDMDTLWNLRYMNSSLREIALDVIYKTVSFSLKSLESTQHNDCFLKFRDRHIARRVQKLGYYSGVDTAFPENPTFTKMVQRYIKDRFKQLSVSKLDQAIVETANRFVNVSSLEFRHLGNEETSLRKSILILNTTLRTCFNSLKILVLQLPIAHISEVMLPTVFIPHLTSLFIAPNYSSAKKHVSLSGKPISATIVPFLNRHRHTLTALHLRLDLDGPSLFIGLEEIKSLKEFSVDISLSTQHKHIAQFLGTHSRTLERIHIISTEPTFKPLNLVFEDVSVTFPELVDFSTKSSGAVFPLEYGHNFKKTGQCICKSAASLVSLSILNAPMDNDEFFQFLPPHRYTLLQDLRVSLSFITCQTLDFLENALPNLRYLEINASRIQSAQNDPIQVREELEFFRELSHCDYSRWKLEEFKLLIDVRNLSSLTVEKYIYSLIAKALRSVKTFNGVPLAEVISSGPLPIVL